MTTLAGLKEVHWHHAVNALRPFIFRIKTPGGSGTGFLLSRSEGDEDRICGVATAAHVVKHAEEWEQPIRIEHFETKRSIMLRPKDRAVFMDVPQDTAAIVFDPGELGLPNDPPGLIEEGKMKKVGVEVGWMGFPALAPDNLCFFSGRISSHNETETAYLVDGVAINGVSGGPTLWLGHKKVEIIGVVSAYVPNVATGETLPGLVLVSDVEYLQEVVEKLKSIDDAKDKQTEVEKALAQDRPEKKDGGISSKNNN